MHPVLAFPLQGQDGNGASLRFHNVLGMEDFKGYFSSERWNSNENVFDVHGKLFQTGGTGCDKIGKYQILSLLRTTVTWRRGRR